REEGGEAPEVGLCPAVEGVLVALGAVHADAEEGVADLLRHHLRRPVAALGPEHVERLAVTVAQIPALAVLYSRLLLAEPFAVLRQRGPLAAGGKENVADDLVVRLFAFDADAQPVPPAVGGLPAVGAEIAVVVAGQVGQLCRPPPGVFGALEQ